MSTYFVEFEHKVSQIGYTDPSTYTDLCNTVHSHTRQVANSWLTVKSFSMVHVYTFLVMTHFIQTYLL